MCSTRTRTPLVIRYVCCKDPIFPTESYSLFIMDPNAGNPTLSPSLLPLNTHTRTLLSIHGLDTFKPSWFRSYDWRCFSFFGWCFFRIATCFPAYSASNRQFLSCNPLVLTIATAKGSSGRGRGRRRCFSFQNLFKLNQKKKSLTFAFLTTSSKIYLYCTNTFAHA